MDVAFVSSSYTRNLYSGIVEVTPIKATGLPDEEAGAVEGVMTGGGCDACLLVAAIEGQWKEDVALLEKEMYNEGILDLTGSAHIGRSSTIWSNVDKNAAEKYYRKKQKGKGYHIRSGWGKGGQAIWPNDENPFYLYVQDPSSVRLVFTILDDAVVGDGDPVGSTYKKLSDLIPSTKLSQKELIEQLKQKVMEKIKKGEISQEDVKKSNGGNFGELMNGIAVQEYQGELKLTSKPRIKDKNGQVMLGTAAGAAIAGPLGAAVGGALANMYEGEIRGRFEVKLRYLPFPNVPVNRNNYVVLGGIPGITWGALYDTYLGSTIKNNEIQSATTTTEAEEHAARIDDNKIAGTDLEHCFFIENTETGGCCAVYRSVEKKTIIVSFRGTCETIDLITDASVVQKEWVEGEDAKENPETTARVHNGFKKSLNSISRRLKELILATVEPGTKLSEYDMYVTGHSLGGALATLFVADIGEFGIDAGRGLPQLNPSDKWWKGVSNLFGKNDKNNIFVPKAPPRPKSLKMYNFGSPRVGDKLFADRFDSLLEEGKVDAAFRVVNGEDIVARLPRSVNAIIGRVSYDHVGTTVLVNSTNLMEGSSLWIEGVTDNSFCPVRDAATAVNNPLSKGFIADIRAAAAGEKAASTSTSNDKNKDSAENNGGGLSSYMSKFTSVTSAVSDKLKSGITVSDVTSLVGIDKSFTDREFKIIKSFAEGNALAHHMEDEYYAAI